MFTLWHTKNTRNASQGFTQYELQKFIKKRPLDYVLQPLKCTYVHAANSMYDGLMVHVHVLPFSRWVNYTSVEQLRQVLLS